MANDLWTTGQTSGLTHIPPQTLRRYVHLYREFFSETAQRPSKGRRFTQQDINNLLMIRHLYNANHGLEKIQAALKGEWVPPAKPQYDNLDALTLVENARQQMTNAGDYARQARANAQQAQNVVNAASHMLDQFRDVIAARVDHRQQIPVILEKLEQLEKRIEKLEEKKLYQDANKRRGGLFGLGG